MTLNKLYVALLTTAAALITSLQMADSDWRLSAGTAVSGVLAAFGVWYSTNTVNAAASKFWAGTLGAVGILVSALFIGADLRTTLSVFSVAILGYGVVYLTPNTPA